MLWRAPWPPANLENVDEENVEPSSICHGCPPGLLLRRHLTEWGDNSQDQARSGDVTSYRGEGRPASAPQISSGVGHVTSFA